MGVVTVKAHQERNPKTGKMVMHKAYSYTTSGGKSKASKKSASKKSASKK